MKAGAQTSAERMVVEPGSGAPAAGMTSGQKKCGAGSRMADRPRLFPPEQSVKYAG